MEVSGKRNRSQLGEYSVTSSDTIDPDVSEWPKKIRTGTEEMNADLLHERRLAVRLENQSKNQMLRGSSSKQFSNFSRFSELQSRTLKIENPNHVNPEFPTASSPVRRQFGNQGSTNFKTINKPTINKASASNSASNKAVASRPLINKSASGEATVNKSPMNKCSISAPPMQRQLTQQSKRASDSPILIDETSNSFPLNDVTNGVQKPNSNLYVEEFTNRKEKRLPEDLCEIQRLQGQLRIREEKIRALSSENRFLRQKLDEVKGVAVQCRKELRNTKIELEYIQSLNKKWQECAINKCSMVATMFTDINSKLQNRGRETEEFNAPVGHENSGKIHLGRGVWLPKETYLLACSNIKHSTKKKFVRNILVSIFGYDILASSTVTGKNSNRSKKNMKPEPLDPAKLLAVKDIYRFFLMTNLNLNCHDAEIEADQTNRYITKKIAQIKEHEKRPKGGKNMGSGRHADNSDVQLSPENSEAGSCLQMENHSGAYDRLDLDKDYSEMEDHQFREHSLDSEDHAYVDDSLDPEDSNLVDNSYDNEDSHFIDDPLETKDFQYSDNFIQPEDDSHFTDGPSETKDSIRGDCTNVYGNADSHFVDVSNVYKGAITTLHDM